MNNQVSFTLYLMEILCRIRFKRIVYTIAFVLMLFLTLVFSSCNRYSPKLKEALSLSGENKGELLKVLAYFEEDSFKYAAATYVVENLTFQYNEVSSRDAELSKLYNEVSGAYPVTLRRGKFIDGLSELSGVDNYKLNNHLKALKSDFLISYIESVCQMYLSKPWCEAYPFEIFAEYVLPYYLENESIELWHPYVQNKYKTSMSCLNYEKGDVYEVEDHSVELDTIVDSYSASNGRYVKLYEGESFELKNIVVNYRCVARLLMSHFNGNDSSAVVLVSVGGDSLICHLQSTEGWGIKYHKRTKCDFELNEGIYDFRVSVLKGSVGLDVLELKLNDYYEDCKVDFGGKVYRITNPTMGVGLSIEEEAFDNKTLTVDDLEGSLGNFSFAGNDYGFFAVVNQDRLDRENTLDLLNFQYADSGKVILWDKLNTDNQKWAFVDCGSGTYRIVNKYNGKCLTTDGENVFLLKYNGQLGQQWYLEEQEGFSKSRLLKGNVNYERGDIYEFESYYVDSASVMEQPHASGGKFLLLNEGDSLILKDMVVNYDCMGSFIMSFIKQEVADLEVLINVGKDTVKINGDSNLWREQFDFELVKGVCNLEVKVDKGSVGLDVLEMKFNDYLEDCSIDFKSDIAYEIKNPYLKVGLFIDNSNYKYKELAISANPESFGLFGFAEKEFAYYKIVDKTPESDNTVFDLLDFQFEDFGKIILWDNIGNLNQEWLFVHSGNDLYRIVNRYNGKCLTTDGEKVFLLRYNGEQNQLWSINEKEQCNRIDELIKPSSSVDVAARLAEEIRDFDFFAFPSELYSPKVSELIDYRSGSCLDEVRFVTSLNRAFGVPVTYDYVLQWPFRNDRHWWPVLIGKDGRKIKYFMAQKPYENNFYDDYPKGKVFRKTYAANEDAILFKEKSIKNIPPLLRGLFYKDVTAEYDKVHDASVPIKIESMSKKVGYVCVFNNSSWLPIWGGDCLGDTCIFKDLTERVMYLPVFYEDGSIQPFYYPFNIEKDGELNYKIPNKDSLINLTLKRKYPFIHWAAHLSNNVQGGVFEASNDPEFKDAEILWRIDFYVDGQYYEKEISPSQRYKYFRYVGPHNSFCMINEIMLYDKEGNKIDGSVIGTAGSFENRGETLGRVFDGDILTGFNAPFGNNAWVGYRFKDKVELGRIGFVPRNDGNIIEPGDEYELKYYDNGWVSCGRKIADQYQISFKNIPSNALYILHNHTKGREERNFTYENNEQVWW